MNSTEDAFYAIADDFRAAALDGVWDGALSRLAEFTGSRSGQLIGVGSNAAVPFNQITNLAPEAIHEWAEMNGADPVRNARVRAGLRAAELEVLTEADFASEADLRGEVYALYRRHGIHHSAQTTLVRQSNFVAGLAILRDDRQGPVEDETKKLFGAIAPHVRGAVRLHMALEEEGAALVAGAFGSMSMAAFICDPTGAVCAMSPAAEALVSRPQHLGLSRGQLRALHAPDDKRLSRAIAEAGGLLRSRGSGRELEVRAPGGGAPLQLQVAPLAEREYAFRFRATTLVVARPPRDPAERAPQLQSQFGLTTAETQVALALARGQTLAEIAADRQVAVATLRSQLKSIFGKLGVRRQAELAAKLGGH